MYVIPKLFIDSSVRDAHLEVTPRQTNRINQQQKLLDLCHIVNFSGQLQQLNFPDAQSKVWSKLPKPLQHKWRAFGNKYEIRNNGKYPPFEVFINFLDEKCSEMCNINYQGRCSRSSNL